MKLDVPDDFVNLLMKLDKAVRPDHVINALKRASENPSRAVEVLEAWRKLRGYGKTEFQTWLSLGLKPDEPLECAKDYEARQHEKLSFLRKALAEAKKGGFKFTLPNGVECTIELRGKGNCWFKFNPGGEEVYLIYSDLRLSYVIEMLRKEDIVVHYGLSMIVYEGKGYRRDSPAGKIFLKAIEQNVNPKVLAAVDA